ncbi:sirohydrochlorin chelatase [Nocardia alba]|uniref:Sirohydrochlorin ferrochelatase n=1 Tax=Nocardia alba TaxID=225051 RepID=A0A4R1FFS1_9NOCA|nr:sirohydrochlorin chelatase [Nocardia alba]TCJ93627.1 sirohydrochlorin ferrochelatase [Nocardia alba]
MYRLPAPARGAISAPRGGGPALIAVAHGSRDPRSAATMAAVVAEVATARPDIPVRLAFLDLSTPSVDEVVDDLAIAGHTDVIVVPLLLGNAFHARVDLPALLVEAGRRHPRLRLTQAAVLGPDPLLIAAVADRVARSCRIPLLADRATPVVPASLGTPTAAPGPLRDAPVGIAVAAVGSRDAAANRRTAVVARRLAAVTGCPAEMCFATVEPSIGQAVDQLRGRGAERIVVAPWFLAPGLLTDRLVAAAPEVVHADVIGAHSALVDVIWARYDTCVATELVLSA